MSTRASLWMQPIRFAALALLGLAVSGCSMMAGNTKREGPFLRAGQAIGPLPGYSPSPVQEVEAAVVAPSGVPAGYTAANGMRPLPQGYLPGVGPVHALVLSMSLGYRQPAFLEPDIAEHVFGESVLKSGTVAADLYEASRGAFRFSATVLPTLIDPNRDPAEGERLISSDLRGMVLGALREWSEEVDLAEFDNNGPDGIPQTADDDGRIDMLFLAIESDHRLPSYTIPGDFEIRSRGNPLTVGQIHVLSVPRTEQLSAREATGLVFDALGLGSSERFFPEGFPRQYSSIAFSRLGWVPVRGLTRMTGTYALEGDVAVTIPLRELESGAGFWLLERNGSHVFATRAARDRNGQYQGIATERVRAGEEQLLTLNRQLGARGPSAYLRWPGGAEHPAVEMLQEGPGPGWAMSQLQQERRALSNRASSFEDGRMVGSPTLLRASELATGRSMDVSDAPATEPLSLNWPVPEGEYEVIDGVRLLGVAMRAEENMHPSARVVMNVVDR